ncbi:alkaline phosphatase family protein [Oceanobacillus salinisoli]|uniref:alkaline phosphatase family protein n=1 Tax=Oceanobacillus salinisoli TaxID=2678611 RepID=UPI0012E1A35C|nr:alkaline phosphatase family protein [Oceanobacillus salinisoli]
MIKKLLITLITLAIVLSVLVWFSFKTPEAKIDHLNIDANSKPVILLLVDSLMDKPLKKAMEEDRAPALSFLKNNGNYIPDVVSSYPTMSVTIDSSLLTGTYADQHQIPALAWYKEEEQRLINYGSSASEIYKLGVKQVLNDSIQHLNKDHLNKDVSTIFEDLDDKQKQSAAINVLVYRGNQDHKLHIPRIASTFDILPKNTDVKGPNLLSMGVLSQFSPENNKNNNVWQGLGINDAFSVNEINYLIENDMLPSFTFAYLPDLDKHVHEKGQDDLQGIEELDNRIAKILDAYPTWGEALEKMTILVYGDSGQAPIKENETEAQIDLTMLSDHYRIPKLGNPIEANDELMLGVNSRMSYIYLLEESLPISKMTEQLLPDDRIGFLAWKDEKGNHVLSGEIDKTLTFRPEGKFLDPYGKSWSIDGDPSALDISVNEENRIKYGDYPDALARLYGALHSHEGRFLIVDAKPGYEFIGEGTPTHAGGAGHGSLNKEDSTTPLIIAGTESKPPHNRVIDFKEWILQLTNE